MNTGIKIRRNIFSSLLYQALTLILGISIPRLVLVSLGSEANGLINSTNQAIVYLALLEGGMGLSITQSLYGPVAKNEHDIINGIMSAANIFYRNVGTYYFIGLIVLGAVYSITVQSSFSPITIFVVVLLTGLPQVINFLFQGKYRTLISVNGKGYVLTNLNTVVYVGTCITKIILLLSGFGIVTLQLMYCVVSLIQMVFIVWYVKREFPWLNVHSKPEMEKLGQRSSVFIHQISGFIFSNTDMLLLTYFCDLKMVSVYSMYTMFYSMVSSTISSFTGSLIFAMGQKFNSDRNAFIKLQNQFETLNFVLVFSCYSVLCLCILPFLRIYTAGINDIEYIYAWLPYYFATIQLLQAGRFSSQKVIEYAGEFRDTQWHSAVEAVLNIVVSIVAVIKYGIYGVLIGTIVALFFRSFAMISYACRKILHTSQFPVYKKWGVNIGLFILFQFIGFCPRIEPHSYVTVVLYAGVLMIIAFLVFGGAAFCYDPETCKGMYAYLKKRVKNGI